MYIILVCMYCNCVPPYQDKLILALPTDALHVNAHDSTRLKVMCTFYYAMGPPS